MPHFPPVDEQLAYLRKGAAEIIREIYTKYGIDVNVRLSGSKRFSQRGVGAHAINAPIRLPRMNEMIVAIASRPTVHGTAAATISRTCAGKCASE